MKSIQTVTLKDRRELAGLKQVQLAALAGVGVATVNKCERWGFPLSTATAAKLATVLRCEPGDLLKR